MKLLLIEDDVCLALSVRSSLKGHFDIDVSTRGEDGLFAAMNSVYDLVLLDISLPDMDGLYVCKEIRKMNRDLPIIFLTGVFEKDTKYKAFVVGGDDYVTKPFDKKELIARIHSLIRRFDQREKLDMLQIGNLKIDLTRHVVIHHGHKIDLRKKEFNILSYLARNAGRVISRERLQSYVWGDDSEISGNTIDVHINYLRDKIDKPFNTHLIQTIHGIGYCFFYRESDSQQLFHFEKGGELRQ